MIASKTYQGLNINRGNRQNFLKVKHPICTLHWYFCTFFKRNYSCNYFSVNLLYLPVSKYLRSKDCLNHLHPNKCFSDNAWNTVISANLMVWKFCGKAKLRYFTQCEESNFDKEVLFSNFVSHVCCINLLANVIRVC